MTYLEINCDNVRWNLNQIRRLTNNTPLLAMVKANAYGMGAINIVKILKQEGVKYFGVSTIEEALEIRAVDKTVSIINFGPFDENILVTSCNNRITPTVSTKIGLRQISRIKTPLKVFLKVNTGLNRWGLSPKEVLDFSPRSIEIDALATTLVEIPNKDRNQIVILKKLRDGMKKKESKINFISFASSEGLLSLNLKTWGLIRPGITLYGIYPDSKTQQEKEVDLKPIFSLKSSISQIRKVKKGESILYKNSFVTAINLMTALIPIGTSLGYNPLLKNEGMVLVGGNKCPVIGISMSATIIDVSRIKNPTLGQEVVLIGQQGKENISIYDLGKISGLSPYYLMSSLSPNLKRIYINERR